MQESDCYCWAMDDSPEVCTSCEKKKKMAQEEFEKFAREQIELPENDENRIFSNEEIYNVEHVHYGKNMMHRKLLQKIRQILNIR